MKLDSTALEALEELGRVSGEDLLEQVIESYLDVAPRLLESLSRALANRDHRAFGEAAHDLGGITSVLGAQDLARHCGELVDLARRRLLSKGTERLEAVEREHRRLTAELARFLAPTTPGRSAKRKESPPPDSSSPACGERG